MKTKVNCSCFVPTLHVKEKESEKVLGEVQPLVLHLQLGNEGYNEFLTLGLELQWPFRAFFPDGNGDPTSNALVLSISNDDTDSFAMKLKHLIKFREYKYNQWVYCFVAHPRFGYCAYNILFRKRLLKQGNFYIKKNGENSIEELRVMAGQRGSATLMNKIILYAKIMSTSLPLFLKLSITLEERREESISSKI